MTIKTNIDGNNETHAIKNMADSIIYGSFPYNKTTDWKDLENFLKEKKEDVNFVKYQLFEHGFIDHYGAWNQELIKFGLVTQLRYYEVDVTNSLYTAVNQTLLSDRGVHFIELFLQTIKN